MRIKNVTPILAKRYLNPQTRKRAVFLRGKSGIGKSEVVFQTSDFLAQHVPNWKGVIDLRLAQMDPTDLRGVPYVDKESGRTSWARPDFLPADGAGLLFLDELTSAPPAVQAAAYQLTLTPEDYGIPAGWMVVCAGNHKSDRGVTFNIAGPLQNRLCDISVDTTVDDFIDHASSIEGFRAEVLSYLKDRGDHLHNFEEVCKAGDMRPFASPRSWFAASHTLDLNLPESERVELLKGDLGVEAASTFEVHLRVFESMPRIDDILEGRDVPLPKDMSVRYCVAMGLAMRMSKDNFNNAWKFLKQMPGEIQTLTVRLAFKRDANIAAATEFQAWAVANQSAFRRT